MVERQIVNLWVIGSNPVSGVCVQLLRNLNISFCMCLIVMIIRMLHDVHQILRNLNNWTHRVKYRALRYFKDRHVSAMLARGAKAF